MYAAKPRSIVRSTPSIPPCSCPAATTGVSTRCSYGPAVKTWCFIIALLGPSICTLPNPDFNDPSDAGTGTGSGAETGGDSDTELGSEHSDETDSDPGSETGGSDTDGSDTDGSGTDESEASGDSEGTSGESGGPECGLIDNLDTCGSCVAASCCDEALACALDEGCTCVGHCLLAGPPYGQCYQDCGEPPQGHPAFLALKSCTEQDCEICL